jgi:hypothetical protein
MEEGGGEEEKKPPAALMTRNTPVKHQKTSTRYFEENKDFFLYRTSNVTAFMKEKYKTHIITSTSLEDPQAISDIPIPTKGCSEVHLIFKVKAKTGGFRVQLVQEWEGDKISKCVFSREMSSTEVVYKDIILPAKVLDEDVKIVFMNGRRSPYCHMNPPTSSSFVIKSLKFKLIKQLDEPENVIEVAPVVVPQLSIEPEKSSGWGIGWMLPSWFYGSQTQTPSPVLKDETVIESPAAIPSEPETALTVREKEQNSVEKSLNGIQGITQSLMLEQIDPKKLQLLVAAATGVGDAQTREEAKKIGEDLLKAAQKKRESRVIEGEKEEFKNEQTIATLPEQERAGVLSYLLSFVGL